MENMIYPRVAKRRLMVILVSKCPSQYTASIYSKARPAIVLRRHRLTCPSEGVLWNTCGYCETPANILRKKAQKLIVFRSYKLSCLDRAIGS